MKYPRKRRSFSTLSKVSYKMAKSMEWNFNLGEIDDVCASERFDLQCDLNCILLGKLPRFYMKRNGHLKPLSIDTILESQFIDSCVVRTILSDINREWIKEKPLQLLGKTSFGQFQDKPPKRVLKTDGSVERCLATFKNEICECLIDFCQLLNSEDLYLFLTKDNCDLIVEKRFEKLRSELTKNIEKWCGMLQKSNLLRKRSRNKSNENHFSNNEEISAKSRKIDQSPDVGSNKKTDNGFSNGEIDIERELDEIIQAQLFEANMNDCSKSSINQFSSEDLKHNLNLYENNDKTEKIYAEEQACMHQQLENEFDYFANEIIKLNNEDVEAASKISKNDSSKFNNMNIYEDIDADIIMANVVGGNIETATGEDKFVESNGENKENMKFSGVDKFTNDINIITKNALNRTLRKKKLDLDDYDDYEDIFQKKHKKRKEDKKHKKRKRNKHKNDSVEKLKSKNSRRKDKFGECYPEVIVPKYFTPNLKLYTDSELSYTFDPYQNTTGLEANFDPGFDLLKPPKTGHDNPIMKMFLDNYFSGTETFLQGFIPDVKQFCIEMVNSKNAFIWALMLTNIDNSINSIEDNKHFEDEIGLKKQQSKTTSNPLIQAFKQALGANKKKEESNKSASLVINKNRVQQKHGIVKSKFNFRHPPGLSSLFKLQTNLKSTSRASIKEVMIEFQQKLFKLAKKENFMNNKENISNSTLTDIDYSATPAHFNRVSKTLSVLYDEAEWKITNKIKLINFDRKFFNNAFAIQNSMYHPMIATDPNMLSAMYYPSGTTDYSQQLLMQSVETTNNPSTVPSSSTSNVVSSDIVTNTVKTQSMINNSATLTMTSATNSIAASPITYSSYAYNPYAAMQYANIGWPYMNPMGYYMPDMSTIQAYNQTMYGIPTTGTTTVESSDYQMMNTSNVQTIAGFDNGESFNAIPSDLNTVATTSDGSGAVAVDGAVVTTVDQGKPVERVVVSQAGNKKDANIAANDADRQGKNTRFYVFKNETEVSREVEKYLDLSGLKKFDIHNLMLLRHLQNFECLVFVHKNDGPYVNEIPVLLRLKRDLRVVFISYESLEDVKEKNYSVIFPRAGTVLMDETALIACRSEVLESVCQFMKKQTFEKGTPWKLLITSKMFHILEKLKVDSQGNKEEHARFGDIIQILQKFQATNIVEELTNQYYMSDPRSTADYQACFVALQRERYVQCRHFLFVTDMPRTHPDSRMFLTNGIDIMNIAEFMRCFVSKTITYTPKVYEAYVSRTTPEKYNDPPISDCTQTITF